MKSNHITTIVAIPLLAMLSSCATKGPKSVSAGPLVIPQRQSPTDWAVDSAPRTQPGRVMDPDANTYAQVPKRIIYTPGSHGLFGRQSAQQEVAYDLVPVDRIPEVQARSTPAFQPNTENAPKWSAATFADPQGNLRKGKARRLGVVNKTVRERGRAEALLDKSETLEWLDGVGWVGFTETDYIVIKEPEVDLTPPPENKDPEPLPPIEPELERPSKVKDAPKIESDDKDDPWFDIDGGLAPLR